MLARHRAAVTAAVLAGQLPGDALRDDPPHPGRGRRGEQVAGAFAAHPVVAVAVAGPVGGIVGQVGELVKDNLGAERGQRLGEGTSVEHVADHGLRAKLAQQAGLPGGPDHTRHHMPIGGKQRDQPDADDAAGRGDEDPHSTTA